MPEAWLPIDKVHWFPEKVHQPNALPAESLVQAESVLDRKPLFHCLQQSAGNSGSTEIDAVEPSATIHGMSLDDYKVVLYRNEPAGWVAEIPSISGCHALMPTREAALAELAAVFQMIADEYRERNEPLPADTTEILHG